MRNPFRRIGHEIPANAPGPVRDYEKVAIALFLVLILAMYVLGGLIALGQA